MEFLIKQYLSVLLFWRQSNGHGDAPRIAIGEAKGRIYERVRSAVWRVKIRQAFSATIFPALDQAVPVCTGRGFVRCVHPKIKSSST